MKGGNVNQIRRQNPAGNAGAPIRPPGRNVVLGVTGSIAAYNALNASYNGQPVGIVFPTEGVPVAIAPVAILQNAPHPNAAALFYQFLASKEVGKLLSNGGLLSGRSDVEPPRGQPRLEELKPYFADLSWLAKNERRMAEQFDDIMAR